MKIFIKNNKKKSTYFANIQQIFVKYHYCLTQLFQIKKKKESIVCSN